MSKLDLGIDENKWNCRTKPKKDDADVDDVVVVDEEVVGVKE